MVILALLLAGNVTYADIHTGPDIRLVLQITIDGLRADLLNRYEEGFGEGGFRYLVDKGAVYHVSRSGDIYLIQEPSWFLFDKGPVKVMHGSPWRYDTHVPLIFMGPGISSITVHRRVHPVDVAPTLAALLGMTPPGSAQGTPLEEVFQ
jgi:predicted AlkP superfamily pyrophosphatase or phosphodiesterase